MMMITHELKTWPEYFKAIVEEKKKFEIRLNDRNFKVGDSLLLREYDPERKLNTGMVALVDVTYILKFPVILTEYACMSIELIQVENTNIKL